MHSHTVCLVSPTVDDASCKIHSAVFAVGDNSYFDFR